jgi:hypothetical protein
LESQKICELRLEFGSEEPTEQAQLDRLARQLNKELQQADIDSDLAGEAAPTGTRSGLEVAAGAILVKVAPDLISVILKRLKKFISRSPDRTIKAKVQLGDRSVEVEYPTDISPSDQDVTALVEKLTGTLGNPSSTA